MKKIEVKAPDWFLALREEADDYLREAGKIMGHEGTKVTDLALENMLDIRHLSDADKKQVIFYSLVGPKGVMEYAFNKLRAEEYKKGNVEFAQMGHMKYHSETKIVVGDDEIQHQENGLIDYLKNHGKEGENSERGEAGEKS